MKLHEFNKALAQGKIAPYYYLQGEVLLAQEACENLTAKALEGGERSLNLQIFYAGETEPSQVISSALEFPFLSRRRVVLIKQAEKLKAKEQELYIPYLSSPAPQTCLIFWAWEKPSPKEALPKWLKQKGGLIDFAALDGEETRLWIENLLRTRGYAITPDAVDLLMLNNEELLSLKNEIEKAMLFAGEEKVITLNHVEAGSLDYREKDIYDLTRALGQGNYLEAEKTLRALLQRNVEPLLIFGMVVWQLRRMIKIKELAETGAGPGLMAKQIRMNPAEAQQMAREIKNIPWEHLHSCLREAARVDHLWKRGDLQPSWALTLLAKRLCLTSRRG